MKIAIVEDEKSCRDTLKSYLERYAGEKDTISFGVSEFSDGADFMIRFKPVYDIIFLDIEMPNSNGMEIARKIRETDKNVVIVFITNMVQYALQGYEVQALDFIVKPISYSRFAFRLERAVISAGKNADHIFSFSSGGRQHRVSLDAIYYLEVIKHCVIIHTDSGNYEVWHTPISEMEQRLTPYGFARCNVSYLVNLRYVSAVSGNVVTVGSEELSISRGKRKEFLAALSEFMG